MRKILLFLLVGVLLFSGCAASQDPDETKNPSYEGEFPAVYAQIKSLPDGEFRRTKEYVLEKEKDCLYVRYLVPYVPPFGDDPNICILYEPPHYGSLEELFTELLEGDAAIGYRNYAGIRNTEKRYLLVNLQDLLITSLSSDSITIPGHQYFNGGDGSSITTFSSDDEKVRNAEGRYEQFFTVEDGQTFVERKEADGAETFVLQDPERGRVERTRFRFSQGDYSYYVMDSVYEKSKSYQEKATRMVYLVKGESCSRLSGTPESLTEEAIRSFVFLWSCDF
ncbi:MAG: hypothetical protein J6M34_02400 [Clostridia bacterium]|nr:hypothetical protein [Clostridia bacterium]